MWEIIYLGRENRKQCKNPKINKERAKVKRSNMNKKNETVVVTNRFPSPWVYPETYIHIF